MSQVVDSLFSSDLIYKKYLTISDLTKVWQSAFSSCRMPHRIAWLCCRIIIGSVFKSYNA